MIRLIKEADRDITMSPDECAQYRYYIASLTFCGSDRYRHIVIDEVSRYPMPNGRSLCLLGIDAGFLFEKKINGWGPTTLCVPLGLLDEIIIYESFDEMPIDLFLIATGRILEKPLLKISDIYQYSGIVQ